MFYIYNIILFLSIFYFFYSLLYKPSLAHNKFKLGKKKNKSQKSKKLLHLTSKKLNFLFKSVFLQNILNSIQKKITYAGLNEEYSKEEYFSLNILSGLSGFFLSLILSLSLMHSEFANVGISHLILLVILFTLTSFFLPFIKLNEIIAKRKKEIIKELPFTLDLITISVEAGLDFSSAISRIIERSEMNELLFEFNLFLNETSLGKRKSDALLRMAERINMPSVTSIITNIAQAEQLGMSIGNILKIQSRSHREKAMQNTEKKAMEAPVKMIIPLALFIFPAVFIVLLGPLIIQFITR